MGVLYHRLFVLEPDLFARAILEVLVPSADPGCPAVLVGQNFCSSGITSDGIGEAHSRKHREL